MRRLKLQVIALLLIIQQSTVVSSYEELEQAPQSEPGATSIALADQDYEREAERYESCADRAYSEDSDSETFTAAITACMEGSNASQPPEGDN